MIKFECNSRIAKDIVKQLNDRLAKIPLHDYHGHDLANSYELSKFVDSIKNIKSIDETGDIFCPFGTETATRLVMDELHYKKENNE